MNEATVEILKRDIKRESGHCWWVRSGSFVSGDGSANPQISRLELFEDGKPLGPAHALHDDIRTHGGGLFSHWGDVLYFSTSDNSDPCTSGRIYTVTGPRRDPSSRRTTAMDAVAKFKAAAPFALEKEGVAYKVTELTLFERYLRFIVHAASNEHIEAAELDLTAAQVINVRTDESPFPGATAYVFDGLLTRSSIELGEDWAVIFVLQGSRRVRLDNGELIASEPFYNPSVIALWEEIDRRPPGLFVEVGGRGDTSIAVRERLPAGWDYLSVDIHLGPNVDLQGDAHRLSEVIEPGTVDVYYSSSTFEHLAQPWLAVLEANKVLKIGGLAFTDVPQSFPLHAKPWDYWRYAPYTWPHLFSKAAGFEIVEIGTYCECKIVPIVMRDWNNRQVALEGGGWLGTACLGRKIANTTLEWKGYAPETDTAYPFTSDFKHHRA